MPKLKCNLIIKLLVVIVMPLLLLLPFTKPVFAAPQTLRVSPVIINVTLSPGKTYTRKVTVENLGTTPLPLRTNLTDFMTGGEEGGYVFAETKNNPLLSWVKLDQTEFILNPKEKKTLQMTITTPDSIPVGGYYGVQFFEPVVQGNQSEETRVNTKVGILMLANIGVPDPNAKKAEILDFSTDLWHTSGTVPVLLRVKNIALHFFSAKPTLKITPLLSYPQQSKEFTLEEKMIFPGNVRRWTETTTVQDLSPNIYKAHIIVSTGNGQTVEDERFFVVMPIAQPLIAVISILIILFFIKKRKNLTKAIKTLFGA